MEWLNYHHLFYFWTVVRSGSITRASKELRLAPPTISAQLRLLEENFGEELLTRVGRHLTPTETGRVVYGYAEEIFSLGREMMDAVRQTPESRPLRIVVGINDVLPKRIAHQLIEPTLGLRGSVRILCREANLEQLIAELAVHEIDVILSDAPVGPNVSVRAYNHLLGESGVLFMGTEALATRFRRGFPDSLNGAPVLLPTNDTAIRRSLDQWFDARSIRPRIVGEFEDYALLREFARSGTGLYPTFAVLEKTMRQQDDVQRIGEVAGVSGRFYAISAERKLRHPAVVTICEAARKSVFTRNQE
jgi:LysR family transcriptional regulator, transcriptional activator of nhaA